MKGETERGQGALLSEARSKRQRNRCGKCNAYSERLMLVSVGFSGQNWCWQCVEPLAHTQEDSDEPAV